MNQPHFVPKLEDFRVGYEYERYLPGTNTQYEKKTFTWADYNFIINCYAMGLQEGWLRVPYINPDAIKQEGWKQVWKDITLSWNKGRYILTTFDDNHRIIITYGDRHLFDGICNDINTFRQIFKLIEV
jgi:hypothetical protein